MERRGDVGHHAAEQSRNKRNSYRDFVAHASGVGPAAGETRNNLAHLFDYHNQTTQEVDRAKDFPYFVAFGRSSGCASFIRQTDKDRQQK
jgi:hypothetical protein